MERLSHLHLNVAYPPRLVVDEVSLPLLLVRQFPSLTSIYLENFITRQASLLDYTLRRTRINTRVQWILRQHNKVVKAVLN